MELGFAEVEAALARVHGIGSEHRTAFAARLKNFQRMGYPAGLNTGRGKAARYHVGHLIQLGLALELSQLGMTPERAATVLSTSYPTIVGLVFTVCHESIGDTLNRRPYGLYFDPRCLAPLMQPFEIESSSLSDKIFGLGGTVMLGATPEQDYAEILLSVQIPRFAFVSISSLMNEIAVAISSEGEPPWLYPAALDWAIGALQDIRAIEARYDNNPQT